MSQVLSVPYSLHSGSLTLTSTNGNKYRITVDDDGNLISILIPVCPTSVTDIDGNIYQTVIMGEQCWMKENLRTTKDKDGRIIARYYYNNSTINCDIYGGLYSWATVMNGAASSSSNPSGVPGICPAGCIPPKTNCINTLSHFLPIFD